MNKYEENKLALIEKYIPEIQKFLDKTIIGSVTMTAADIAEKFLKGNKSISTSEFVDGFRVAVREGKLTGVESAKRAGYKRAGAKLATASDSLRTSFQPYEKRVQEFVDVNIHGKKRMTAAEVYQGFLNANGTCILNEDIFIQAFRLALREGRITGLESCGPYGYKHSDAPIKTEEQDDDETAEIEPEEAEENTDKCIITIDENRRIAALDERNWGYQKRSGNVWLNTAYFANSANMVQSIARKMFDEHFKRQDGFDIHQIQQKLADTEQHLTNLLQQALATRDWGRVCKKLHLANTSTTDEVLAAIQSLIEASDLARRLTA